MTDSLLTAALPVGAPVPAGAIEADAMFRLSYGLFVLTARQDGKDNGCIINTAMQITTDPQRMLIAVNKANHTHDMIAATGVFNVSILTEEASFDLFKRFGFQSGRDVNKFEGFADAARSENGLYYLTAACNAVLSGRVVATIDCGTHTLFVAEVTEAKKIGNAPSVTYAYYFAHIKPKPEPVKKASWVCKICGYVYEGDPIPEDYICPLCKHPASDFERRE